MPIHTGSWQFGPPIRGHWKRFGANFGNRKPQAVQVISGVGGEEGRPVMTSPLEQNGPFFSRFF